MYKKSKNNQQNITRKTKDWEKRSLLTLEVMSCVWLYTVLLSGGFISY